MAVIIENANSADGDAFRAVCRDCGWTGARRWSHQAAGTDGIQHVKDGCRPVVCQQRVYPSSGSQYERLMGHECKKRPTMILRVGIFETYRIYCTSRSAHAR